MGSPRIWVQRTTRPISSVLHELLVHAVLDLRDCNGLAVDFTTESCEGHGVYALTKAKFCAAKQPWSC